jgi:hypothetical protein
MVAPNEFWLEVYRLAAAYDAEGLSAVDRDKSIVAEFHAMSPIAQRELLAAILRLAVHVPAIYSLVLADMKKTKRKHEKFEAEIEKRVA